MKIGLFGLPKSGKTTLFNALTKSQAQVASYALARAEPNVAIVQVGDARLTMLSEKYVPKKTTYATVEIVDFAGVAEGAIKEESFPPALMKLIRSVDALAIVARAFPDEIGEEADPARDIRAIDEELLLCDLLIAEKRLEKIRAGYQRGQKGDALLFEEKVLVKIAAHLNDSRPVRELSFDAKEDTVIRGFQFLTKKPAIAVINADEASFGAHQPIIAEIAPVHDTMEFAGKFEMELSRLSEEEEIRAFMEDLGIKESARDRLIGAAYKTLGYISFFTVGADEVRAWPIRNGSTAVEAAGAIHSDLARGFIAAECFSYDDLAECGSEKGIKDKGRMRLEGKEYLVKDGDILNIRFNV